MNHVLFQAFLAAYWSLPGAQPSPPAQDKSKQLAELLRIKADELIQHFDKNNDGVLAKDEVPGIQPAVFDKLDLNRDGRLDAKELERTLQSLRSMDKKEVERMFQAIQERSVVARETRPDSGDSEVTRWLQAMDQNRDGRISRQEAQGRIREFFNTIDVNRDGFLDKKELQLAAVRILAAQPKSAPTIAAPAAGGPPPDFDTVDQNADGRITRDELQATPFGAQFDAIDANKDGRISPKEWEAFVKKLADEKVTQKK
jgi:Ca2+-binding EF-hand superfamily protein